MEDPALANAPAPGASGPTELITLEISADLNELGGTSARVLAALEQFGLSHEEAGSIDLLMAEILANIIKHAYPGDQKGTIRISVRAAENNLMFEFEDRGIALPGGRMPFGSQINPEVELQSQPEGGFGWFLIRALAKDIAYSRAAGRNRLTFRVAMLFERPPD